MADASMHLPNAERDRLRCQEFGYIFQFYHLLPELSTLENVLRAGHGQLVDHGLGCGGRKELDGGRAMARTRRPVASQDPQAVRLSGGEMQRAAVARALITIVRRRPDSARAQSALTCWP